MNSRAVERSDEAEWLRRRAALWPDEEQEEPARTVRQFLVAPDPALEPARHAVFVCPRPTGGLYPGGDSPQLTPQPHLHPAEGR